MLASPTPRRSHSGQSGGSDSPSCTASVGNHTSSAVKNSESKVSSACTGRHTKSMINVPLTPRTNIGRSSVLNSRTSRAFRSVNSVMYCVFSVPNTTRLYSHTEYAAERTIPAVEKSRTVLFCAKIPRKISNSPRKFEVAGKLIFASVKAKKNVAKRGITVATPP